MNNPFGNLSLSIAFIASHPLPPRSRPLTDRSPPRRPPHFPLQTTLTAPHSPSVSPAGVPPFPLHRHPPHFPLQTTPTAPPPPCPQVSPRSPCILTTWCAICSVQQIQWVSLQQQQQQADMPCFSCCFQEVTKADAAFNTFRGSCCFQR